MRGWNLPLSDGRALLHKIGDFARMGDTTSRAIDKKEFLSLRFDPRQPITAFNAAYNHRRQQVTDYRKPAHVTALLESFKCCFSALSALTQPAFSLTLCTR